MTPRMPKLIGWSRLNSSWNDSMIAWSLSHSPPELRLSSMTMKPKFSCGRYSLVGRCSVQKYPRSVGSFLHYRSLLLCGSCVTAVWILIVADPKLAIGFTLSQRTSCVGCHLYGSFITEWVAAGIRVHGRSILLLIETVHFSLRFDETWFINIH